VAGVRGGDGPGGVANVGAVNNRVVPCALPLGPGGITYELVIDLDLGDPIGRQVVEGRWKLSPALMWLLASVEPGDTVLDLGAHYGTFTIPAAMLGAQVVAVEGSPRNAAVLRSACARNRLDNVQIVEAVVDGGTAEVEFVDLGPYGTISTPTICSETGYPTIRRTTTVVDEMVPTTPITWAKIDIEGKEHAVLGGARRMLGSVQGMVIESNGYALHSHGTSPQELIRSLEAAGLAVYEVNEGELRPVGHPLVQPETIVDYAAVRGAPPLPTGWTRCKPRSDGEIIDALIGESMHAIPEHRDHALRTIDGLSRKLARRYRRTVATAAAATGGGAAGGGAAGDR